MHFRTVIDYSKSPISACRPPIVCSHRERHGVATALAAGDSRSRSRRTASTATSLAVAIISIITPMLSTHRRLSRLPLKSAGGPRNRAVRAAGQPRSRRRNFAAQRPQLRGAAAAQHMDRALPIASRGDGQAAVRNDSASSRAAVGHGAGAGPRSRPRVGPGREAFRTSLRSQNRAAQISSPE